MGHKTTDRSKVVQGKPEEFVGANPGIPIIFQQKHVLEAQDLVIICLRDRQNTIALTSNVQTTYLPHTHTLVFTNIGRLGPCLIQSICVGRLIKT